MHSMVVSTSAAVIAAGLVAASLWGWQQAAQLAEQWGRPDVAEWALRSAAVCIAAVAQLLLATLVVGAYYRRGWFDRLLGAAALAVFGVALVSAVALGLAGR
jgi:hypothetical protein